MELAGKTDIKLERIDPWRWRIRKDTKLNMHVEGRIYSSPKLIDMVRSDASVNQVANVASLPGIVGASLAMPDIHWGYGFPIGGVAAFDEEHGIISPGGVGYDINCGVSLTRTKLSVEEIKDKLELLANALLSNIPCGVGVGGDIKLSPKEVRKVAEEGAHWVVKQGYGSRGDLEFMEEGGCLPFANPDFLSERAVERGRTHLGTLGSGNHFVEVQRVDEVYDRDTADAYGLFPGQVTVMLHSGSRGFGYQVCQDALPLMQKAVVKHGITLVDRQLACAPVHSKEGQHYIGAMGAAANYAWANRIMLVHRVRMIFEQYLGKSPEALGMGLVYDVSHNIAKFETHQVKGKPRKLCVHRKGATRAFAPGHREIPTRYRTFGQPVIIPGDMGSASYVLSGATGAMEETFGSACHGAGRVHSRKAVMKLVKGRDISAELDREGILVRAKSRRTIGEEAPEAYKDVEAVVQAAEGAGLVRKVARLKPLAVIKG